MAEKTSQINNINIPVKGMFLDTNPLNQPDNTYRFALNAVKETKEGDKGFLSNEEGNIACVEIPEGYVVIGHVNLENDSMVLFLAGEDNNHTPIPSMIALHDGCSLTTLVRSSCLNFDPSRPVRGIFRILQGCERNIYFVDGYNPDRIINLDDLIRYIGSGSTTVNEANTNDDWDCSLFKLHYDFDYPCIDLDEVKKGGGQIEIGTYQFAVSYGDGNLNQTEWLSITQPIPIGLNTSYQGGFSEGGDPTIHPPQSNSIVLDITNIDESFTYLNVAVKATTGGTSSSYFLTSLPIDGTTRKFTFSGLDVASAYPITNAEFEEIVVRYKSKVLTQHDNRLIRANLKDQDLNYPVYQRAALQIKSSYVVKPRQAVNSNNEAVFTGDYYFDNRTYMRDEIYAMAIVPVLNDGQEGPAFTVPGRFKDTPNVLATPTELSNYGNDNASPFTFVDNRHTRAATGGGTDWDSELYPTTTDERWKLVNTAVRTELNTVNDTYYSKGELAYWETENSVYPSTKDCDGKNIFDILDINGNVTTSYAGEKVVHHKMPDTTLEPHFVESGGTEYLMALGLEFDLTDFNTYLSTHLDADEYASIQGFKIVRSKRDNGNKTVIDKGIMYKNVNLERSSTNHTIQTNFFDRWIHGSTKRANGGAGDVTIYGPMNHAIDYWFNNYGSSPGGVVQPGCWYLPSPYFELPPTTPVEGEFTYSYTSYTFHGNINKFRGEFLGGEKVKVERELAGDIGAYMGPSSGSANGEMCRLNFFCSYLTSNPPNTGANTALEIDINNQASLNPNANTTGILSNLFINQTCQDGYVVELDSAIDNTITNVDAVSPNLPDYGTDADTYESAHIANTQVGTYYTDYVDGDKRSTCYYGAIKRTVADMHGDLGAIIYYDTDGCIIDNGTTTAEVFGGDCFISKVAFKKTQILKAHKAPVGIPSVSYANWFVGTTGTSLSDNQGSRQIYTNLVYFYVESEINSELRHERIVDDANTACERYYPKYGMFDVAVFDTYDKIGLDRSVNIGNEGWDQWVDAYELGDYCSNVYNYNEDFSKELIERPKFPLARTFDYCSTCTNSYPHRLVYSEKSYQEEAGDNYRVTKANSYRDLNGRTGEISNVFVKNDQLFAHTFKSLWMIPTKPQEIQTNEDTITVGTGEFFEIPPRELVSTDYGYAGSTTPWSTITTEFGTFFVDEYSGKVFLFSQQLNEISRLGLKAEFEENLKINFYESYKSLTGEEFPFKYSPQAAYGVGYLATYDSRYNRIILTKKDYVLTAEGIQQYQDNLLVFISGDNGGWKLGADLDTPSINPYDYPQYFENKSYTLSFDLEEKFWVSYHSYLPNYMWFNQTSFYSSVFGVDTIWKHNERNYQSYYGSTYPHMVELVFKNHPTMTKIGDTLEYNGFMQSFDSTNGEMRDVRFDTFDKIIAYNNFQSSGEIDITVKQDDDPFASTNYAADQAYVSRNERTWSLNNIRDRVLQNLLNEESLFTSVWSNTIYQSQYPIDKVVNTDVIDSSKSQFNLQRFRDKFLVGRLILENPQQRKINTQFTNLKTRLSFR